MEIVHSRGEPFAQIKNDTATASPLPLVPIIKMILYMRKTISLLIAIITLSCSVQEKSFPENFDFGSIQENVYQNSFFEMEITFNPDWFVQDKEQMNNLIESGKELTIGDNKKLEAIVKASEVNTAYLFNIFKYEVGSAVNFNPSLMVIAENTKTLPGIKKGKDYLFHAKKMLEQSQLDYKIEKEVFELPIGKLNFDVMEAKLEHLNLQITQEYISTVIKGFSLSFVISYTNDEEKNELYLILEKIKM